MSEQSNQTMMSELFAKGTMVMGPSRHDPTKMVGTFPPELIPKLMARRRAEMEKLAFMAGDWLTENIVPATAHNPAYVEHGKGTMTLGPGGLWICRMRGADAVPHITFDPFSEQWMYVLAEGAYGILRSPGWEGDRLAFTGLMTMIGVERDFRHTITKVSNDEYHALNEERHGEEWIYVDEWRFRRA